MRGILCFSISLPEEQNMLTNTTGWGGVLNINVKQNKTSNKKEHFVSTHGWQCFACQKLNARGRLRAGWQEQISSCSFWMLKGWDSAEISLTKHTLSLFGTTRQHVIRGIWDLWGCPFNIIYGIKYWQRDSAWWYTVTPRSVHRVCPNTILPYLIPYLFRLLPFIVLQNVDSGMEAIFSGGMWQQ